MITCPKCGKELADGAKFCSKCGTNLAGLAANAAPQDAAPQQAAPQDATPQTAATQDATPQNAAPQDAAPQQATPQNAAPQNAAPQDATPQNAAPQNAAPQNAAPQDATPQNAASQDATPRNIVPQNAAPQNVASQDEAAREDADETKKKIVKCVGIAVAALVFLFLVISLFSGKKSGNHYAIYLKDKELMYSTLKGKAWQVSTKLAKDSDISTSFLIDEDDIYKCVLSKDGKIIFFPDKKDVSDSGTNLYYRWVKKDKKDPVKVDSSIVRYYVNEACNLVTYQKTSSDLYQYRLKKEDKKRIATEVADFKVSDDGKKVVYRKASGEVYVWNGKDNEKIDSDSSRINYVKGNIVYYTKDGCLYKKNGSKDKEKILSGVYIIQIYDSGEIYYACTIFVEEGSVGETSLYYYDGKESKKIAENYAYELAVCEKTPVIAFTKRGSKDGKIPCVAVKNNVSEFEKEDATNIQFSENGKTIFFTAEMSKSGEEGTLYSASVSSKGIGKANKIDEDVVGRYKITNKNKAYYMKDCNKEGSGDLYYDKKKIDTDVFDALYCEDAKKFVFLTDFNSKNGSGTLKISSGGKPKKIADDAYNPLILPNGYVLFLSDYSTKSKKGDLYITKGGKAKKLDEDVSAILSFE